MIVRTHNLARASQDVRRLLECHPPEAFPGGVLLIEVPGVVPGRGPAVPVPAAGQQCAAPGPAEGSKGPGVPSSGRARTGVRDCADKHDAGSTEAPGRVVAQEEPRVASRRLGASFAGGQT